MHRTRDPRADRRRARRRRAARAGHGAAGRALRQRPAGRPHRSRGAALAGQRRPLAVWRARRGDAPAALVFEAEAADGYAGSIRLRIGVDADGRISGVRVTAHRETPGLGDGIEAERSDWITRFDGARSATRRSGLAGAPRRRRLRPVRRRDADAARGRRRGAPRAAVSPRCTAPRSSPRPQLGGQRARTRTRHAARAHLHRRGDRRDPPAHRQDVRIPPSSCSSPRW
jgi:hypothetical protein